MEGWQVRATQDGGAVGEMTLWPLEAPRPLPGRQHAPAAACKAGRMQREGRVVLGFAFSRRRGLLARHWLVRAQVSVPHPPWGRVALPADAGEGTSC